MTLRAPYLTPPKTPITVPGQAPYNLALLAAVVVSSPFVNVDWSKASTIRQNAPDQLHTDISKFTNPIPFVSTDRPSVNVPRPAQWLVPPLNLCLFTNPIPFAQYDWSKPKTVPFIPGSVQSVNTNLFQNPIPFAQYDWSRTRFSVPRAPDQLYAGQSILSVGATPFAQYDWSKTQFRVRAPDALYPNQAISFSPVTGTPFAQLDWSKAKPAAPIPGSVQSVNLNLFRNPIPFAQFDWSSGHPLRLSQIPTLVGFQINPPPIVQVVVDTHDWVKRKRRKPRDFAAEELEIKFKRRQAIEDAIWPPTTYSLPEFKLPDRAAPLPDTDDLSRVIHMAQIEQAKAAKIKAEAEDEEDLLNILKDIL